MNVIIQIIWKVSDKDKILTDAEMLSSIVFCLAMESNFDSWKFDLFELTKTLVYYR